MSSAIIFINKLGVAVAADSAITIGDKEAIFNTAQKIFPIGKKDQAHILVITFANAMFMGVPIELILKSYSNKIEESGFKKNSIEEYMFDFIKFVEAQKDLFNFKTNEYSYLYSLFVSIFDDMFLKIRAEREKTPDEPINQLLSKLFEKFFLENSNDIEAHSKWTEINQIKNMVDHEFLKLNYPNLIEEVFRERLAAFYESQTGQAINPEKMILIEKDRILLAYFQNLIYEKIRNRETYRGFSKSGIYFVGYGDKSLYPSYWGVDAYAFLNGKFIYENDWRRDVTLTNRSWYKTLAQDDSIEAFLIGVDSNKRYEMMTLVYKAINVKFKELKKNDPDNVKLVTKIETELEKTLEGINYFENISETRENEFLKAISVMGVMDMAEYVENLISLQSLKRKYDLDHKNNSTVGGPTDVAIITKFDGFKWVKFKGLNTK
jgi:hypothetical protein